MPENDADDIDQLRAEAEVLCRYLVDRVPGEAFVERYVAAHRSPFGPETPGAIGREARDDGPDRKVVAYCREHPGALPMLDAAAGVLAPRSLLRRKVLLMAAILEASVECEPRFRADVRSPLGFALRAAWIGASATVKLAGGVLLWHAIRRPA